jgi:hypothetical protein
MPNTLLGAPFNRLLKKNLMRDRLCATVITDADFELRRINKATPFET